MPEIWAHFAQDLGLIKKKINYGIFVQGFYHMFSTNNFAKLKKSYEKANIIISDSDYSIKCIKNMFPEFVNKIIRVNYCPGNSGKVFLEPAALYLLSIECLINLI